MAKQKSGGGKRKQASDPPKPSLVRTVLTSSAVLGALIALVVFVFKLFLFPGLDVTPIRELGLETFTHPTGDPALHAYSYGVTAKVSNTNKEEAFLLKDISADSFDVDGVHYEFGAVSVWNRGDKLPAQRQIFPPPKGPPENGLPVQVKSESQQFLTVRFFFYVRGATRKDNELYEAFHRYVHDHGLSARVTVDGKLRDYSLHLR